MTNDSPKRLGDALTPREREIINTLCQGHCNKMIARLLNIREGTVKVHLNNIYTKLGVANRTALALLAVATFLGERQ